MKLLLIDGYGFVFRAFHSLPPLTRPDGKPIGAIYGFTNMLIKVLNQHVADSIAVVLDSAGRNFRHQLFPAYKANRPTPPSELIEQLPIVREAVTAFNIKYIEEPGFEADDLIATYTSKALTEGYEVTIVSSDKDLMQLISDKVSMYDPLRDRYIRDKEVIEKFGIHPGLVVDFLSLIGDSSDNIPGIKGIGPKTAAELINEFGSLDNIFQNLEKIVNPRRKNLLMEGKDNAFLSRRLITLDYNAPAKFDLKHLQLLSPVDAMLQHFLEQQGFKSLLHKVKLHSNAAPATNPSIPSNAPEFKNVSSIAEIPAFEKDVYSSGRLSLFLHDNILQVSVSGRNFHVRKTPSIQADLFSEILSKPCENFLLEIKKVLEDSSVSKICFDAKRLIKLLKSLGISISNYQDLTLMAYATGAARINCNESGILEAYMPEAHSFTSAIFEGLYQKILLDLTKHSSHANYFKTDKPLLEIVAAMEEKGVNIDPLILGRLSKEFRVKAGEIENNIFKIAGQEFNIGSPKQLGEILFEKLGIQGSKKSKSGGYSTSADILEALAEQGHDIAAQVLEWRHFTKLISTYTEALPKSISPITKRVHTNFTLTATSTGRLSSLEPNLQNIPIRTEEGQKIRSAFVAEAGNIIVSADYSQIELRLLAHMANIHELKQAFKDDIDVHAVTASQIFNKDLQSITPDLRRQAKTINFGIIYGISAFGLAKRLEIPQKVAQEYIEFYFKQYPGIKEYMSMTINFARTKGYVETIFGRRCYIKGINDKNYTIRGFAERAAINAPLQGTAADIIKKAMVSLPARYTKHLILQIHDELLFEVPSELADELIISVKEIMEKTISISVPIRVDVNKGKSWAEAH